MALPDNPFEPSETAPPEFDEEELRAPGTVCFRLRRGYWITTLICAGFFAGTGAYGLAVRYFDPPVNEQDKPDIEFVVMCFFFAILSIAPIVWFVRVRLWFTPGSVVYRGLFTQAIRIADINHIVWRINRLGAVVELHGPSRLINIRLEGFEWKDQNAIVAAMRRMFPPDMQSGWNDMFEMRLAYVP